MKYTTYYDGKRVDAVLKTPAFWDPESNPVYIVWVGDEEWGTVYKRRRGNWQAFSYGLPPLDFVFGFSTRSYAVEYVIAHYMERPLESATISDLQPGTTQGLD